MTDLPNDPASLTTKGQAVLEAIWSIGGDMALAIGRRRRVPTPDAKGLYALCNLLGEDPSEERLQCLLEEHPGFITGLVGGPDNVDLAVLFKPPVGFQYKADFCVLQAHQGGAVAWLIEIETAHENLFTRVGNPARRLAHALKQIEDWKIWIEREPLAYSRELIRLAKTMRNFDDHLPGRQGFRLCDPEQLERLWEGFGGFEQPLPLRPDYWALVAPCGQRESPDHQSQSARCRANPHLHLRATCPRSEFPPRARRLVQPQ